jgi:sugar phosphate isomerase/epimerase
MSLYSDDKARELKEAANEYGIEISTLWVGWSGPREWNFTAGPMTLGIVPEAYRMKRTEEILAGADFAVKIGVQRIATHAGFLPENPNTAEYHEVVSALRTVANYCKKNGQKFIFETGQETPVTLLRVIQDSGCDNLGINLDPANLILYGKANPIDALTVFGQYVRDVHAKDGNYPTDGRSLGKEVKVGEGSVNFPAFIAKLKAVGYDGTLTIEREIEGEQQTKDIADTKAYLEALI